MSRTSVPVEPTQINVEQKKDVPPTTVVLQGKAADPLVMVKPEHLRAIAEDLTLLKQLLIEAWSQEKASGIFPFPHYKCMFF